MNLRLLYIATKVINVHNLHIHQYYKNLNVNMYLTEIQQ